MVVALSGNECERTLDERAVRHPRALPLAAPLFSEPISPAGFRHHGALRLRLVAGVPRMVARGRYSKGMAIPRPDAAGHCWLHCGDALHRNLAGRGSADATAFSAVVGVEVDRLPDDRPAAR